MIRDNRITKNKTTTIGFSKISRSVRTTWPQCVQWWQKFRFANECHVIAGVQRDTNRGISYIYTTSASSASIQNTTSTSKHKSARIAERLPVGAYLYVRRTYSWLKMHPIRLMAWHGRSAPKPLKNTKNKTKKYWPEEKQRQHLRFPSTLCDCTFSFLRLCTKISIIIVCWIRSAICCFGVLIANHTSSVNWRNTKAKKITKKGEKRTSEDCAQRTSE